MTGRKSRRLRKLEAQGKSGVTCYLCQRKFAATRDLTQHWDAAHPTGGTVKVSGAGVKVTAHKSTPKPTKVYQTPPPKIAEARLKEKAKGSTPVTNSDPITAAPKVVMLVDLVTPHENLKCLSADCKRAAIPLVGLCGRCEADYQDKLLDTLAGIAKADEPPPLLDLPVEGKQNEQGLPPESQTSPDQELAAITSAESEDARIAQAMLNHCGGYAY